MNAPEAKRRRAYGSGSLLVYTAADGQETWYGRWYVGKKRVSRRIGPKRRRGTGKGLNRTEAEAELRRMMLSEQLPTPGAEVPFSVAATQMLRHLEAIGRKPTTLDNYRAILRAHLLPRFGETDVERLRQDQVEAFVAAPLGHAEVTQRGTLRAHGGSGHRGAGAPPRALVFPR